MIGSTFQGLPAGANGAFKALDSFLGQPRNLMD
jgi:hypothetical protein